MKFTNQSGYPDVEVRALIAFATEGIDLSRETVTLSDSPHRGYHGCAYPGRQIIKLHLGAPNTFPVDNLRWNRRWLPRGITEEQAYAERERVMDRDRGRFEVRIRPGIEKGSGRRCFALEIRHPYGGKTAPLIKALDWHEGLVALASHEACHIWQYQQHRRFSEVECERFAARTIERFRALKMAETVAAMQPTLPGLVSRQTAQRGV